MVNKEENRKGESEKWKGTIEAPVVMLGKKQSIRRPMNERPNEWLVCSIPFAVNVEG